MLKERLTIAIEARHWTLHQLEAALEVTFTESAASLLPAAPEVVHGSSAGLLAQKTAEVGAGATAMERDWVGVPTPIRDAGAGNAQFQSTDMGSHTPGYTNLVQATANGSIEYESEGRPQGVRGILRLGCRGEKSVRERLEQAAADARGTAAEHPLQSTAALVLRVRGQPVLLLTLALSSGLMHLHAAPSQIKGYAVATVWPFGLLSWLELLDCLIHT